MLKMIKKILCFNKYTIIYIVNANIVFVKERFLFYQQNGRNKWNGDIIYKKRLKLNKKEREKKQEKRQKRRETKEMVVTNTKLKCD